LHLIQKIDTPFSISALPCHYCWCQMPLLLRLLSFSIFGAALLLPADSWYAFAVSLMFRRAAVYWPLFYFFSLILIFRAFLISPLPLLLPSFFFILPPYSTSLDWFSRLHFLMLLSAFTSRLDAWLIYLFSPLLFIDDAISPLPYAAATISPCLMLVSAASCRWARFDCRLFRTPCHAAADAWLLFCFSQLFIISLFSWLPLLLIFIYAFIFRLLMIAPLLITASSLAADYDYFHYFSPWCFLFLHCWFLYFRRYFFHWPLIFFFIFFLSFADWFTPLRLIGFLRFSPFSSADFRFRCFSLLILPLIHTLFSLLDIAITLLSFISFSLDYAFLFSHYYAADCWLAPFAWFLSFRAAISLSPRSALIIFFSCCLFMLMPPDGWFDDFHIAIFRCFLRFLSIFRSLMSFSIAAATISRFHFAIFIFRFLSFWYWSFRRLRLPCRCTGYAAAAAIDAESAMALFMRDVYWYYFF